MAEVHCLRCNSTKPGLASAPVGGALGAQILASICSDCWAEWSVTSAQMINHYQLALGNVADRDRLRNAMKQFLGFEAAPDVHPDQPEAAHGAEG